MGLIQKIQTNQTSWLVEKIYIELSKRRKCINGINIFMWVLNFLLEDLFGVAHQIVGL